MMKVIQICSEWHIIEAIAVLLGAITIIIIKREDNQFTNKHKK